MQRWKSRHRKQLTVPMDFRRPGTAGAPQNAVQQRANSIQQVEDVYEKLIAAHLGAGSSRDAEEDTSPANNHILSHAAERQFAGASGNNQAISLRRSRPSSAAPSYTRVVNGAYHGAVGSKFVNKLQEAMEAGAFEGRGHGMRGVVDVQYKENTSGQASDSARVGPPKAEMLYPTAFKHSQSATTQSKHAFNIVQLPSASRQHQQEEDREKIQHRAPQAHQRQFTPRSLAALESHPSLHTSNGGPNSWMRSPPPNSAYPSQESLPSPGNADTSEHVHLWGSKVQPVKVSGLGYAALVSGDGHAARERPQSASKVSFSQRTVERPQSASNVRPHPDNCKIMRCENFVCPTLTSLSSVNLSSLRP